MIAHAERARPSASWLGRGARALRRPLGIVDRGPCDRSIYLTFDDGPHAEHTPRILDQLASRGVLATFFVVGAHAARYPRIVERILREGHALGHHTYAHDGVAMSTPAALLRDVRRTHAVLAEVAGRSARVFRPPRGRIAPWNALALRATGMRVVLWTFDSLDFASRSADDLRGSLRSHRPSGGDIALFHDDGAPTAAVIGEFIDAVRAAGLDFAPTLSTAAQEGG